MGEEVCPRPRQESFPKKSRSSPKLAPVVVTTPTPTAAENLTDSYFLRGLQEWRNSNYQSAITDFNETIRLWPRSARAYAHRGNAFFNLKQYEKAISDYTESIQLCHGSDFSNEDFSYEGRADAY